MRATAPMTPPPAFQGIWSVHERIDGAFSSITDLLCENVSAILIFSDPNDVEQGEGLNDLLEVLYSLGLYAPPAFVLVHSVAPDAARSPGHAHEGGNLARWAFELGAAGLVASEPQGFELALVVRAKMRSLEKLEALCDEIDEELHERTIRAARTQQLLQVMQHALWQYARFVLAPDVPAVDTEIPSGVGFHLKEYHLGAELGRGLFGQVMRAIHAESGEEESIQLVDKASLLRVESIQSLQKTLRIMRSLSRHPGLVQLHEVYHSRSHIFIRTETFGCESLAHRLATARAPEASRGRLSFPQTISIIKQALAVVAFLHTQSVVHRNIMPGNFFISDPNEGLILKLVDFSLAHMMTESDVCEGACGTLPFVAPETLSGSFRSLPADVWSLGMVALEILSLDGVEKLPGAMDQLENLFSPDKYFNRLNTWEGVWPPRDHDFKLELCQWDLQSAVVLRPVLEGMLQLEVCDRWTSAQSLMEVERLLP